MGIIKEFKEFSIKGNVLDMAIGIIIGTAFGKIVTLLVNDIIMPPLGLVLGKVNFADRYVNLSGQQYESLEAAKAAGAATINYGTFINLVLDFFIVAFVMFLMVKQVNRMKRKPEPGPATTKECPFCFSAIPIKATRCPACTSQLPSA